MATSGEVVEFGWEDADSSKPISGRRKKAIKEQKKKNKSGTFESMGLAPWLLKAIRRKGYRLPTPIQRRAIPIVLQGNDVIGMARTGSGKTAAFVIPLLHKLAAHAPKAGARGLILSPTRELALQTHKVVRELAKGTNIRTAVLVGGDAMEAQFAELAQNPDIIVATPGRLLHHLAEVSGFSLSGVEYCVFDEADRMFEMGFAEQVREIVAQLRESRQTLMFSATLPRSLADFAAAGLSNPQLVRLDADRKLSPDLGLAFFTVRADDKPAALLWLLREALPPTGSPTLVFASTRHHVEYLYNMLQHEGMEAACVFGSMDQTARKIHVAKFRAGKVGVLITTDVAARGIDIPLIDNVINYDFPGKPELFVHRCGRAARAGRSGSALSLLTRDELPFLLDLHLYLGRAVAPAPVTPDPQELAAAAAAAEGAGSLAAAAAAAGSASGSSVYGHFPGFVLDPLIEHLRELVEAKQDLCGMQRSLDNAYRLYLKTRPAASSESVKRSRTLPADGPHPLLLARVQQQGGGLMDMQHEVSLAEFTAKLKAFRPAATVLEAEIAKVRPSHAGPTMQTELEAAVKYKSNDVMSKKRAAHAHIVEKERQKRRLAEEEQQQQQQGVNDEDDDLQAAGAAEREPQQQQQQQHKKQKRQQQQHPGSSDDHDGISDAGGSDSDDDGSESGSDDPVDDEYDGSSDGSDDDDDQKQQQQQPGSSRGRQKGFVLPAAVDGSLAEGKYKDDNFFISHTRDGRTHTESFEFDNEAAQLNSAVLDLTGEDQAAMTAQKRQYRWDKKKKAYVNTAGTEDSRRGLPKGLKRIRTESGKVVLAGGKDGKTGEIYKKWAKHHKHKVAATGAPEDVAADPDLSRRFDKGMRHKSFKIKGAAPTRGAQELKSKQQVIKERKKKQQLQQGMRERAEVNAARKEGGGKGRGRGGGSSRGRGGSSSSRGRGGSSSSSSSRGRGGSSSSRGRGGGNSGSSKGRGGGLAVRGGGVRKGGKAGRGGRPGRR